MLTTIIQRISKTFFSIFGLLFFAGVGILGPAYPIAVAFSIFAMFSTVFLIFVPFSAVLGFGFTQAFGELFALPFTTGGFRLSMAILLPAFLFLVISAVLRKDKDIFVIPFKQPVHLMILAFFIVMALSLINSKNLKVSIMQVQQFVYCIIMYLFITISIKDRDSLRAFITVLLCASFLVAILGLVEAAKGKSIFILLHGKSLFGAHLSSHSVSGPAQRIWGTAGDPEFYGIFMNFILALTLASIFGSDSWKQRLIFAIFAILLVTNIIGTAYKGAILATFVSIVIFWNFIEMSGKWMVLAAVVILISIIGVVASSAFTKLNIERLVSLSGEAGGTVDLRKRNIVIGLHMLKSYPFIGTGPDGFVIQYPRYSHLVAGSRTKAIKAHNTYIQILVEYGILGFTFLMSVFFITFIRMFQLTKVLKGKDRFLAAGFMAALGGYMSMMMTSNLLLDLNLWLVIGLSVAMYRIFSVQSSVLVPE